MSAREIDLKGEFTSLSDRLGSNPGGFFQSKADGQEYYVKWLPTAEAKNEDRIRNEFLALKLYDLFGLAAPKAELIRFTDNHGQAQIGLMTPKQSHIKKADDLYRQGSTTIDGQAFTFDDFKKKAQVGFLIDVLLGNYDVVGLEKDNLHYDEITGEPFRIDPGGALRYRAQGGDKLEKGQFGGQAHEFEEMVTGSNEKTRYNAAVLKAASTVFSGVYGSESLSAGLELLNSVSDEQIRACVYQNYRYKTPYSSPESEKEGTDLMADTLVARKHTLIAKATAKLSQLRTAQETMPHSTAATSGSEAPHHETTAASGSEITADFLSLTEFLHLSETLMREIELRSQKLTKEANSDPAYIPLRDAAQALHRELRQHITDYRQTKIDLTGYAALCHLSINKYLPILETAPNPVEQRHWNRIKIGFRQFINSCVAFITLGHIQQPWLANEQKAANASDKLKRFIEQDVLTGEVSAERLVQQYPRNEAIVDYCQAIEPTSILKADKRFIQQAIQENRIALDLPLFQTLQRLGDQSLIDEAIQRSATNVLKETALAGHLSWDQVIRNHPDNHELILSALAANPESLLFATSESLLQLQTLYPTLTESLISACGDRADVLEPLFKQIAMVKSVLETPEEVISALQQGFLDPVEAVKKNPNNAAIVKAAFEINNASIRQANREIINQLGASGDVTPQDITKYYGVQRPSDTSLQDLEHEFTTAIVTKDWQKVANICHKFWFEKPATASYEAVKQTLIAQKSWQDLYQFEKAYHANQPYTLTEGPLPLSPQTTKLEALMRKLMHDDILTIESRDDGDYFVFADGTEFNWTQIRSKANFQHVELTEADFQIYEAYFASDSSLDSSMHEHYLTQLYDKQGLARPTPPLSFAEMAAINIYTGGYYTTINGLMRDETAKFDYRTKSPQAVKRALIQSVMANSGLRKIPLTTIETSYRGAKLGTDKEQQRRVEAAATHGVEILEGMVSSSIDRTKAFGSKPVIYTFKNLKGAYIEPVSQHPHEREFLIPPTQVRIRDLNIDGTREDPKLSIEASLVEDLNHGETPTFTPVIASIKLPPESLVALIKHAQPEAIIQLVRDNKLNPDIALRAFSNNLAVIKACLQHTPKLLPYVNPMMVPALIKDATVPPQAATTAFPKDQQIRLMAHQQAPSSITPPVHERSAPPQISQSFEQELRGKIYKIQLRQRAKTPSEDIEPLIRVLLKTVCKTSDGSGYSCETPQAKFLIKALSEPSAAEALLKNSDEVCEVFKVDPTLDPQYKADDLTSIMRDVCEDKPIALWQSELETISLA